VDAAMSADVEGFGRFLQGNAKNDLKVQFQSN
jgi:hypothetical protein